MPTSTPINIKNLIEDLKLISSNNIDIIYDIINHILNNNYINYDFQAALKIIYNNLDDKLSISLKNRQYDLVLKLTSIRQSIDTLETQLNLICNSNTNKNITQNINSTSEITTSSDHANIESLDNNIDICSINDMPLNNTIIAQIITYDLSNDIDFTKKILKVLFSKINSIKILQHGKIFLLKLAKHYLKKIQFYLMTFPIMKIYKVNKIPLIFQHYELNLPSIIEILYVNHIKFLHPMYMWKLI